MNDLGQGLLLSLFGILITFSALGILILVIVLLKTLFKFHPSAGISIAEDIEMIGKDQHAREDLHRKAAAAAVSALFLRSKITDGSGLGKVLESPPSNWWNKALDRVQFKE